MPHSARSTSTSTEPRFDVTPCADHPRKTTGAILKIINRSIQRVFFGEPTEWDRLVVRLHHRATMFLIRHSRPGPCACRYVLGVRTSLIHDCEEHFPIDDLDEAAWTSTK